MKHKLILALLSAAMLVFVACDPSSVSKDEDLSNKSLIDLQKAHPTPRFQRSQLRQNLVEIITAEANTTQTTTFMFNQGVPNPISQCPSIGFPIPATAQLTNPVQRVGNDAVIDQVEPTGVYTGDTSGTYVMCIDAQGKPYAVYWEGFVQTVTGPAEWKDGKVTLVGPPSFNFTAAPK